jgi:hypothetical protein
MASSGTFRFRVLVGMRRVPLHARDAGTAQTILGPACAEVNVVHPADVPEDDDRELFVTAWCMHPRLIPDEQVIFIPEPRLISPAEAAVSVLPGMRYLVRLRLLAIQDWSTPLASPGGGGGGDGNDDGGDGGDPGDHGGPPTPEEDLSGRRDSDADDDSADSNCNRFHPGFDRCRCAGSPPLPHSVQIGAVSCPLVPGRSGPMHVTRGACLIGAPRGIPDVASPRPRASARRKICASSNSIMQKEDSTSYQNIYA